MLSVPYSLGAPKKYIFLIFLEIQCYLLIHYPRRFMVLYLFDKTSNSRNYKLNLSQFTVFPIYSIVNLEENHDF